MFTRIAINYLRQWAEKEERKPLVLRGARQVGKTTLVDLFAKDFEYYIYINLEEKENANLFANYSSFEDLLSGIFFKAKTTANSGRTLIFIDEIQNEPNAVQSLRYFYEKRPDLYVIAAGCPPKIFIPIALFHCPVGLVSLLLIHQNIWDAISFHVPLYHGILLLLLEDDLLEILAIAFYLCLP